MNLGIVRASAIVQRPQEMRGQNDLGPIFQSSFYLIKRFDDVSPEIRLFMAQLIGVLFREQLPFKKEVQEFCMKRVEDLEEDIRATVLQQVASASIQHSSNTPTSIMPIALFNKMLLRTLDKKETVRMAAIEWTAKLFAAHLRPYWRNHKALPPEMRALLPIPKQLVSVLNSVPFKTKLHIEGMLDQQVIGNAFFKKTPGSSQSGNSLSSQNQNEESGNSQMTQVEDEEKYIMERMNVVLGIVALLSLLVDCCVFDIGAPKLPSIDNMRL